MRRNLGPLAACTVGLALPGLLALAAPAHSQGEAEPNPGPYTFQMEGCQVDQTLDVHTTYPGNELYLRGGKKIPGTKRYPIYVIDHGDGPAGDSGVGAFPIDSPKTYKKPGTFVTTVGEKHSEWGSVVATYTLPPITILPDTTPPVYLAPKVKKDKRGRVVVKGKIDETQSGVTQIDARFYFKAKSGQWYAWWQGTESWRKRKSKADAERRTLKNGIDTPLMFCSNPPRPAKPGVDLQSWQTRMPLPERGKGRLFVRMSGADSARNEGVPITKSFKVR